MNAKIRYIRFENGQKVILPDPPEGFPTLIDIGKFAHLGDGIALALAMGEHMRANQLALPNHVLYETET